MAVVDEIALGHDRSDDRLPPRRRSRPRCLRTCRSGSMAVIFKPRLEYESISMARVGHICRCAFSDGVPRRSLIVALIVGTILNLINQGDALVSGMPLDVSKLLLTYLVPYCVSTYGAVSYRLHAARLAAIRPEPVMAS
jgi:hypothetical protein